MYLYVLADVLDTHQARFLGGISNKTLANRYLFSTNKIEHALRLTAVIMAVHIHAF